MLLALTEQEEVTKALGGSAWAQMWMHEEKEYCAQKLL